MNTKIGFSTSNAWYSRVIRWATRAKVSHTFLLIQVWGRDLVLEEGTFGWTMRTFVDFQANNRVVAVKTPVIDIDAEVQKSFDWLGQRYSYEGLVGMSWVMLCRWFGRKVRNPLTNSHAMFCSEANARILREAGYPGSAVLDPESTDPESLLDFLNFQEAK